MESNQTVSDPGRGARFTALYTREYSRVHAFAHRRTADGGEAEEIAAEVFRIAWEHELKGGETTPGWLFVTARNVLGNHYRATVRLSELHRRIGEELGRAPASPEERTVDDVTSVEAPAEVLAAAKGSAPGAHVTVSYTPPDGGGPEVAALAAGKEYVLLLERQDDGRFTLVNTAQGAYGVSAGRAVAGEGNPVTLSPGVLKALRLTG